MPLFRSPDDLARVLAAGPSADERALSAARKRQSELTKPPGALGRLEEIGIWLAGWQGTDRPHAEPVKVTVFAGNHGVAAEGVSPYPAEVTRQMVANFERGGAAINALSRAFGLALDVVALDLDQPTQSFVRGPAMSEAECLAALNAGAEAIGGDWAIHVFGEMGIANTTSAAAVAAATFGGSGTDWAGAGTGLDARGIARKAVVIDDALALHRREARSAFEILRRLGGRELAAIAGAVAAARAKGIPVVLDGFVATAAAAPLTLAAPGALSHCIAGHVSAERGHRRLLDRLGMAPLLDLGMRLGEGTGAALAVQVLRAAAATQSDMATFAEAGVSGSDAG
ncbi:MAG: nicotinate-nucleotide--dimethylbenzimidazole phosphoribosyltransferase [Hyphomicrobiaceae bacterium]